MCRPGGDRLSLTATGAAHARSSFPLLRRCVVEHSVAHLHISDNLIVECSVAISLSAEFIDRRISGKMDADPLTADSPLSMSSATSMAVESTSGLKLSKEEEDYLEKLMAEKKTVDQTAALDLTQKLLNAGICLFNFSLKVDIFHLMRLLFDWWPSIGRRTSSLVFPSTFVKSTTVERGAEQKQSDHDLCVTAGNFWRSNISRDADGHFDWTSGRLFCCLYEPLTQWQNSRTETR